MPQLTLDVPAEKLQQLLFELPPHEFLPLAEQIQDRAETLLMMQAAQTAFRDWEHEDEDIYEAEPETE